MDRDVRPPRGEVTGEQFDPRLRRADLGREVVGQEADAQRRTDGRIALFP